MHANKFSCDWLLCTYNHHFAIKVIKVLISRENYYYYYYYCCCCYCYYYNYFQTYVAGFNGLPYLL